MSIISAGDSTNSPLIDLLMGADIKEQKVIGLIKVSDTVVFIDGEGGFTRLFAREPMIIRKGRIVEKGLHGGLKLLH